MDTKQSSGMSLIRIVFVGVLILAGFFGAYRFALARDIKTGSPTSPVAAPSTIANNTTGTTDSGGAGASGCACCGSSAPTAGGVTGVIAQGTATVTGGVQKISVDLSKGYYQPNQIVLKQGVAAEITFGPSSGCTSQVISEDLGFSEDLSAGPKTVRIASPKKGEYSFYCGMQMVFGKIVVK